MTRITSTAGSDPAPAQEIPSRIPDLLRLAWPSILSFVANSAYRVNDQFWVGGLGGEAHAALGPCTFVTIANFSLFFLAVAGSMSLVARATGARDDGERDQVITHALVLAAVVALAVCVVGRGISEHLVAWLGLEGVAAGYASAYLDTIYLFALPIALAPLVETIFVAMGNTRTPLILQLIAVGTNFVLNPCLIFGLGPFPALGIVGAALATAISRTISSVLGLFLLHKLHGVRMGAGLPIQPRRLYSIAAIGAPSAASITIYAAVYFAIIRYVLSPLGEPVLGGLAIGFNAFEGVAFPVYLGLAIAGSSLVGRNLGAGAVHGAVTAVRSMRRVGLAAGLGFAGLFAVGGPYLVPLFTDHAETAREAMLYVGILAFSQVFVAMETVHEKILLGAGDTGPIFWVSVPGNALRVPLAWWFAGLLGGGAAGVWWAVNLTTLLKSLAFMALVARGRWKRPGRTAR